MTMNTSGTPEFGASECSYHILCQGQEDSELKVLRRLQHQSLIMALDLSTLAQSSAPAALKEDAGPWGVFYFLEVNSKQQQS